jgi:hypothetical protein
MSDSDLRLGDKVEKVGGDYSYRGTVVSVLTKASGATRVVVENADGMLFIFNPTSLRVVFD